MTYSSAPGTTIREMVRNIMEANPLNVIVGQPTNKKINTMTGKMNKMVAAIKTTAWEGKHGSLSLVLENLD